MSRIYDVLQRLERERAGAVQGSAGAPDVAAPNEPIDALLERAAGAMRFRGDLERRVTSAGVDGIADLLGLYERLRATLAELSASELERTADAIAELADRLARLQASLLQLQSLKHRLGSV